MTRSPSLWLSLIALLAMPRPALATHPSAQTGRAPALATAFQQPGEDIERSRSTEIGILETVLRFYNPPGSQSRWLDAERLPPVPDATAAPLDGGTIAELVQHLGAGRFCPSDKRDACRSTDGGALRVSLVYRRDDTHARIAVRFESHWFAAPSVATTQVFFLERRGSAWHIISRASVATRP